LGKVHRIAIKRVGLTFSTSHGAGGHLPCRNSNPKQVFKHGIRVGSISPGPVVTSLLSEWPPEKLKEAKETGSVLQPEEVAEVVLFMLTRPCRMTIRDVVMMPTNFDL
jgi:NADP-dependent 3-hydroxy acid dehydrogenase YdfG